MSFHAGGFNNQGFYVVATGGLAVVEGYTDAFAAVVDIMFTTADLAVVEGYIDALSGAVNVITGADLAAAEPADLWSSAADISVRSDFAVTEVPDIFAGTSDVVTGIDLDAADDPDFVDAFAILLDVVVDADLAGSEETDSFFGRAFAGDFFLDEQEILYVQPERTAMSVPGKANTIRIAAAPDGLEELPEEREMQTKKRNRGGVRQ